MIYVVNRRIFWNSIFRSAQSAVHSIPLVKKGNGRSENYFPKWSMNQHLTIRYQWHLCFTLACINHLLLCIINYKFRFWDDNTPLSWRLVGRKYFLHWAESRSDGAQHGRKCIFQRVNIMQNCRLKIAISFISRFNCFLAEKKRELFAVIER